MEALSSLLSSRLPQFQTHQALLILGLQEDFISPKGKLPVSTDSGFVGRIKKIVPRFRDSAGEIIWVRTVLDRDPSSESDRLHDEAAASVLLEPAGSAADSLGDGDVATEMAPSAPALRPKGSQSVVKGLLKKMSSRKNLPRGDGSLQAPSKSTPSTPSPVHIAVSAVDEELFLDQHAGRDPCCLRGTPGAEFASEIHELITRSDILLEKPRYSAFDGTQLLTKLRTRFITELYICGCMTNVSVYATAMDAARHGLRISVIEDCLGYRAPARHARALQQLPDVMGATLLSSTDMLADLAQPTDAEAAREHDANEIEGLLAGMIVKGDRTTPSLSSSASAPPPPASSASTSKSKSKSKSKSNSSPKSAHPSTAETSTPLPVPSQRGPASTVENARTVPSVVAQSRSNVDLRRAAARRLQPDRAEDEVGKEADNDDDDDDAELIPDPAVLRRPRTADAASASAAAPPPSGSGSQSASPSAPAGDAAKNRYVAAKVRMRNRRTNTKQKDGELARSEGDLARKPSTEQFAVQLSSAAAAAAAGAAGAATAARSSITADDKSESRSRAGSIASISTNTSSIYPPAPRAASTLATTRSSHNQTPPAAMTGDTSAASSVEGMTEDEIRAREALSLLRTLEHDVGRHESIAQLVEMVHDYRRRTEDPAKQLSGEEAIAEAGKKRGGSTTIVENEAAKLDPLPLNGETVKKGRDNDKGPEHMYGSGDSFLIPVLIQPSLTFAGAPLSDHIFSWLYNEVHWQTMYHQTGSVPRLVCAQGAFGRDVGHIDGRMPVYRHPSDTSLPLLHFTPAVQMLREEVVKHVGHEINHCLIQLYRSGNDYISEHSDKTLDIVRGSSIVNVSFGAMRTMRLRTKRAAREERDSTKVERETQRIPLPHNSLFVLGQESNMRWLHGINPDKRRLEERLPDENAYAGMRISLTFRHIGTFLSADSSRIWGQGAKAKAYPGSSTINGIEASTEEIVRAFGTENQSTEFDWPKTYGDGFDVLHFKGSAKESRMLFLGDDEAENKEIQALVEKLGDVEIVAPPPALSDVESAADAALKAKEKASKSGKKKEKEKRDEDEGEEDDKKEGVEEKTGKKDLLLREPRRVCLRDVDPNHTEVEGARNIVLYLNRYR